MRPSRSPEIALVLDTRREVGRLNRVLAYVHGRPGRYTLARDERSGRSLELSSSPDPFYDRLLTNGMDIGWENGVALPKRNPQFPIYKDEIPDQGDNPGLRTICESVLELRDLRHPFAPRRSAGFVLAMLDAATEKGFSHRLGLPDDSGFERG